MPEPERLGVSFQTIRPSYLAERRLLNYVRQTDELRVLN